MVSRTNDGQSNDRGRLIPEPGRRIRRVKALRKIAGRRAAGLKSRAKSHPVRAAGLLGLVGLLMFAPLLLDDMVFHSSYLLQPSEDTLAINEATPLSDQPPVRLVAGTVSLPPSPTGKARTGEALEALVKGGSARMALKSPVFQIDLSGASRPVGGSALDFFLPSIPPLIEALQSTAFETLAIRDGTIVFDLGGGRRETLTALDGDVGLKRRAGGGNFKGTVQLRGEPVRFDLTFGGRVDRKGTSRIPIKGNVESALFKAVFDGGLNLERGLALTGTQIDITIPNVRSLARSLGHTWPSGAGFKDFAARGTLDWTGPTLSVTGGRYWLDGNEATGTMAVTLHPERPLVAGTLAFGSLDLTPYLALAATSAQAAEQRPQRAIVPAPSMIEALKAEPDLRWPMLGLVDADLRVSAQDVRIASFEAGRTAASVTIKAGQLIFNVAEVLLDGGSRGVFEFGVTGTASYPNYLLRGRLEETDLTVASHALVGMAVIRARGQAVFDVSSSGTSGADVLSRVNGKLDINLPEGAAIPCNHKALEAAAAKTRKVASDVCGTPVTIGPAHLSARLASGRIIADRADGVAGAERVSLKGSFDFTTGAINAAITTAPLVPIVTPAVSSIGRSDGAKLNGTSATITGANGTGADGVRAESARTDGSPAVPSLAPITIITVHGYAKALTITSVP